MMTPPRNSNPLPIGWILSHLGRLGRLNRLGLLGCAGLVAVGCTAVVGQPGQPGVNGQGGAGAPSSSGGGVGNAGGQAGGNGAGGVALPGTGGGAGGSGGVIGGGGSGGPVVASCDGLTSRRVRRLSRREYTNVVSDLLGAPAATAIATEWPADPRVGGFDNQDAFLFVSASLQESLAGLAARLASQANPTTLAPCATAAGSPACLQTFIRAFAGKAYGRPLTDAEFTRANTVASMGENYATSVRLVVELVLQSPNMLYVSELGALGAPPTPQQPVALTPHEVASQLSFLLSGTRPDPTLAKAADTATLATAADIQREATRLLATERAKAELSRFIEGWLDMGPVVEAPKSTTIFPQFTAAVAAAMQTEFNQFVTTQLAGGDGTLSGFMTATSTAVPAALNPIYGADMLATGLDPKRRRGALSLPAVLTFHATDQHSGPVERGLLVRRQLLCQYIPGPPQAALDRIATNPVDPNDKTATTRQKFQAHLDEASCKACHASFDPIGFGFEQMDGLGRFRTTENGMPIDSTGMLSLTDVDGPFEGPAELSAKLAPSKMLEACMVEHFFNFAVARPSGTTDACVVQDWTGKFSKGGGRIKDLVLNYVVHPSFVKRKDDR